jgi:hypothetical protein
MDASTTNSAIWVGFTAMLVLSLAGLGGLCIYTSDRRLRLFVLVVTLTLPCHWLAMAGAWSATWLRPYKLDLYFYRADGLFGFQPSFALGQLILPHPMLKVPAEVAYRLLAPATALVFAGYLWVRGAREALSMIPVFLLNLAFSVPCYLLVPVCGPGYAFASYPALPREAVVPHPILTHAAPANGFPSIHFSAALLIFWYARKLPWGRWIGGSFLLLTLAATLGTGEHYLFDLVAAAPYALLVYKTGNFVFQKLAKSVPAPNAAQG